MISGNSTSILIEARNTASGMRVAGDAANFTLCLWRDGTTASPTNSAGDITGVLPGRYQVNLTAAEMAGNVFCLGGVSATPDVVILDTMWTAMPKDLSGSTITAANMVSAAPSAQQNADAIVADARGVHVNVAELAAMSAGTGVKANNMVAAAPTAAQTALEIWTGATNGVTLADRLVLLGGTQSSIGAAIANLTTTGTSLLAGQVTIISDLNILTGGAGIYGATWTLATAAGTAGLAIVGADVTIEGTGGNIVAWDRSDVNGVVELSYNAGTYIRRIADPGHSTSTASGMSIALTGNTSGTLICVPFSPGAVPNASACALTVWFKSAGNVALANVVLRAKLVAVGQVVATTGLELQREVSATSGTDGAATITLTQSSVYDVWAEGYAWTDTITTPAATSGDLVAHL